MLKMCSASLAYANSMPSPRQILAARKSGDYALVWYVVAAIVLFALAATILLGAIIFCDLKGQHFGAVRQANWYSYQVGCW